MCFRVRVSISPVNVLKVERVRVTYPPCECAGSGEGKSKYSPPVNVLEVERSLPESVLMVERVRQY